MNIVAEMTLSSLRELGESPLTHYQAALVEACDKLPPPFGRSYYGELYRSIAVNPHWMAFSLITSAEREGDGANRLWSLAASTANPSVSAQVKQHAIDESRHSRWYITLLNLTFPEAVEESLRPHLQAFSPGYSQSKPLKAIEGSPFSHFVTLDDLIQMNIAEIRTRIHHLLQRPAILAHCPTETRAQVTTILDSLLLDETRHVAYTAKLIEQFALNQQEEVVRKLMIERLSDFNDITEAELDNKVFEST